MILGNCLLYLLAMLAQPDAHPVISAAALTPEETARWRMDLQHLAREMPRLHKHLYHTLSRDQFESAVVALDRRIPDLSREQIIADLARIVALVGDGHTHISFRDPAVGFRRYPVSLYMFRDGLFLRAAQRRHAEAVGGRVLRIGKASADQAWDAVAPLVSRDNEMQLKWLVPEIMTVPEVLRALGLADDPERLPVILEKDGRTVSIELSPMPPGVEAPADPSKSPDWIDAREGAPMPLWLKDIRSNFWFEYLPEQKTVYVQYNTVYPKPEESVDAFFKRIMEFTDANPVDKLVLDVRLNTGGNSFFNLAVVHRLIRSDKINQKGRLFTIIGRQTFSAAMNLVNLLERHTRTLFVGEPTGASPNHFGDPETLILPNSRIPVRVSTLWWQEAGPRDSRQWRAPDIAAELTFEEYRKGIDPALQTIIEYGSRPSISEKIQSAVESSDLGSARQALEDFKDDPANAYTTAEGPLNDLGYQLLHSGRAPLALQIFKLTAETFPESANAYDSLGEAYMLTGDRESAIRNYERSLELNPKNGNARIMLRRLKQP